MANAGIDQNGTRTLVGLSSADGVTVVPVYVDPVTHRLKVDFASGSGTVTSVSVVSANGFAGTVANATTTPAITLTTTVTGILSGNGTAISAASTTGSNAVVLATSPTLVTPTLGVASASSINKVAITAPATGSTLTIADGKTLTASNTLTFTGTDGSSVAFGTGGTVLYAASTIPLTVGSTTISSGTNTRILFDNSGVLGEYTISGSGTAVAMATSPSFTTPTLGVASATSLATSAASPLLLTNGQLVTIALTSQTVGGATLTIPDFANVSDEFTFKTKAQTMSNKTFVAPVLGAATATTINGNTFTAGTYTLTGAGGKTLTFNNSITLTGTDSTTMTFPSTSATVARTDAAQTFTGTQTFAQVITTANAIAASANAATVPVTSRHNIVTNSSAATLTITLTTSGAVNMQTVVVQILDATAAAQTITWVNTENSTVTAPTTSNGSTSLPLTVGFMYNSSTSKWRCIASA